MDGGGGRGSRLVAGRGERGEEGDLEGKWTLAKQLIMGGEMAVEQW